MEELGSGDCLPLDGLKFKTSGEVNKISFYSFSLKLSNWETCVENGKILNRLSNFGIRNLLLSFNKSQENLNVSSKSLHI